MGLKRGEGRGFIDILSVREGLFAAQVRGTGIFSAGEGRQPAGPDSGLRVFDRAGEFNRGITDNRLSNELRGTRFST